MSNEPKVPDRFRTIGALMLANGIINMTFGWVIAMYAWMLVGGCCTGIVTLGMCPFGMFCGFVSMLMIPLAMLEIVTGILVLASPKSARPFMAWLPWVQIAALLLGDIVSPIIGLVAYMSMQDPEVVAYLDDGRMRL